MAPCSSEEVILPSIGDRVVDDNGFRSTVHYVGSVCTAKDQTSVWIGESICLPKKCIPTRFLHQSARREELQGAAWAGRGRALTQLVYSTKLGSFRGGRLRQPFYWQGIWSSHPPLRVGQSCCGRLCVDIHRLRFLNFILLIISVVQGTAAGACSASPAGCEGARGPTLL